MLLGSLSLPDNITEEFIQYNVPLFTKDNVSGGSLNISLMLNSVNETAEYINRINPFNNVKNENLEFSKCYDVKETLSITIKSVENIKFNNQIFTGDYGEKLFIKIRNRNYKKFTKSPLSTYNNESKIFEWNFTMFIEKKCVDEIIEGYIVLEKDDEMFNILGYFKIDENIEYDEVIQYHYRKNPANFDERDKYDWTLNYVVSKIVKPKIDQFSDKESKENRIHRYRKLKELFNKIDLDKSGSVSEQELSIAIKECEDFKKLINPLGKVYTNEDIKDLFSKIDTNKDNMISYSEYMVFIKNIYHDIYNLYIYNSVCDNCHCEPRVKYCNECQKFYCQNCVLELHSERYVLNKNHFITTVHINGVNYSATNEKRDIKNSEEIKKENQYKIINELKEKNKELNKLYIEQCSKYERILYKDTIEW